MTHTVTSSSIGLQPNPQSPDLNSKMANQSQEKMIVAVAASTLTAAASTNSPVLQTTVQLAQNAAIKGIDRVHKFISLYWNTKEKKPSEAITKLIALLLPQLQTPLLEVLVKETQSKWFQRMRWDVKIDAPAILTLKPKIDPLLRDLGLTSTLIFEGQYDTALLLAGRANIFLARCHALCEAIQEGKIRIPIVEILVGTQSLHPSELEILKNCFLKINDAKTEADMVQRIAEKMIKPLGIAYKIVVTELKDRKPSTEQTVDTWLALSGNSQKHALIVSDPQFAVYQYLQCMESIFKKNISTATFDLFSKQLETAAFVQLNISEEETQNNPVALHLDTITRTLYTIESQIKRGFIK